MSERPDSADVADEDRETLADWLAPGHSAANIGGLPALLQAALPLRGFAGLFAGSVASVQARLLMLRTLGERADPPEWSPAEIDAQFAWLDATKRDTALKRLNEHGLLSWDAPSRSYRLASIGRIVLLAVEQVLRVAGEPTDNDGADLRFIAGQLAAEKLLGFEQLQSLQLMLGRLVELQESFTLALQSGSESRLHRASLALSRVAPRMAQATGFLKQVFEDGTLGDRAYRTAQRIGSEQSKLMQAEGMLSRSMAEMARQRVTLSKFGITDADLKRWFFEQPVAAWLAVAMAPAQAAPPPTFIAGDVALDVAEAQLDIERDTSDVALPGAVDVASGEFMLEPLPPEFEHWLAQLRLLVDATALADCVPLRDFPTSAYRLSLLGLLGEATGDAELESFTALPLRIDGGSGETVAVGGAGVACISDGRLEPREPAA